MTRQPKDSQIMRECAANVSGTIRDMIVARIWVWIPLQPPFKDHNEGPMAALIFRYPPHAPPPKPNLLLTFTLSRIPVQKAACIW